MFVYCQAFANPFAYQLLINVLILPIAVRVEVYRTVVRLKTTLKISRWRYDLNLRNKRFYKEADSWITRHDNWNPSVNRADIGKYIIRIIYP